jgi:DNA-binding XRE family transcriptional regulator
MTFHIETRDMFEIPDGWYRRPYEQRTTLEAATARADELFNNHVPGDDIVAVRVVDDSGAALFALPNRRSGLDDAPPYFGIAMMPPDDLRARRKALDITQAQLAQWLQIARATVNRWERGREPIPPYLHLALDRLDQLAAFGKTVRE